MQRLLACGKAERDLTAGLGRQHRLGPLDPLSIPVELQTALEALYGHYEKTFELWRKAEIDVPPCFIVGCNNRSNW